MTNKKTCRNRNLLTRWNFVPDDGVRILQGCSLVAWPTQTSEKGQNPSCWNPLEAAPGGDSCSRSGMETLALLSHQTIAEH